MACINRSIAALPRPGAGHRSVKVLVCVRQLATQGRPENRHKTLGFYILSVVISLVGISYAAVPLYQKFCQVLCLGLFEYSLCHARTQTQATGFGGTVAKSHDSTKVATMVPVDDTEITIKFAHSSVGCGIDRYSCGSSGSTPTPAHPCPGSSAPSSEKSKCVSSLQLYAASLMSGGQVIPGETALAFFTATNPTDKPITGVSTYNVVPYEVSRNLTLVSTEYATSITSQTAQYFNKIQCFCFEEQRLNANEEV
jgi:cytochrome c oxidase assembly protein subunit 11